MAIVEYLNYEVLDDHDWELDDPELFENAADADLSDAAYGFIEVPKGEYVLDMAEAEGYEWPFSCRNGVCSNCAAILHEGELEMDGNQVLTEEETAEKNVRLTCIGRPTTDYVRLIYNAKKLDYLQDRVMY